MQRAVFARAATEMRTVVKASLQIAILGWFTTFSSVALAATDTWTGLGADANWNTPANWNTLPVATDALVFAGTTNLATTNDIAAGTKFGGITFDSTAGAFTLAGNSVLLTGDISDASPNAQIISLPLLYDGGGAKALNVTGGSTLALGAVTFGAASKSTNATTLNVNNAASMASLFVQTNTTTANVINIAGGATLNLSGAFTIGTAPSDANNTNALMTIAGGGTFNAVTSTNANFTLGVGSNNNTLAGRPVASVDMSGLANFVYDTGITGTGVFGVGNLVTRSSSDLKLANTSNVITAATVGVGNSGQSGSGDNNGAGSNLFLGAGTNVINTNTINIGFTKSTGSIKFLGPAGSVVINGQAGPSSNVNINVGQSTAGTDTGTRRDFLLDGHNATIQAGTVIIGRINGSTAGTTSALMTFDTGTFNVATSLQIGSQTSASNPPNGVTGTFTFGGASPNATSTGVLNVSGQFLLVNRTAGTATVNGIFNINGGTANINTNITIADSSPASTHNATINLAGGTLNMMGHSIGTAAAPITVNLPAAGQSATISNLSVGGINEGGLDMNGGGTLVLGGSNTYTGNTVVDNGALVVNGTTPNGSAVAVNSGTLSGTGTVLGPVTMGGTTAIRPGSSVNDSDVGTLTTGDLTFSSGTDLRVDLLHTAAGGHDLLSVNGTATFGGGTITPGGVTDTGTYTVLSSPNNIVYNGTPNLVAPTDTRPTFTLHANTKSITIDVGGVAPKTLVWKGTVPDGGNFDWDLHSTFNWIADSADQQFFNLDRVVFNDSATNRTVTLNSSLTPADVSISNLTGNDYVLTGGGSIDGATALTKSGAGKATIAVNTTYNGNTTVTGGSLIITGTATGTGKYVVGSGMTLQVGNATSSGSLGTGSVSNEGTVIFNRTDSPVAITNVISGSGSLQVIGTGTIELNAANTYAGTTTIQNGAVKVDTFSALGAANGGAVTINNGGTLDLSGIQTANAANGFGTKVFNIAGTGVSGNGVIVNNGLSQQNPFQNITLTGAATIGGSARIDLRNGVAQLNLGANSLTKIGAGQFTVVGGSITGNGNVIVNEGTFGMETTTSSTGTGNITYNDGTTAWFFQNTGAFSRPIIINSTSLGVQMGNAAPSNTAIVASPITLNGDLTVTVLNGATTANGLNLTGVISGAHGILKNNLSTLILSGSNTFTGGVTIFNGVVQAGNAGGFNATTPNVVTFVPSAPSTAALRTGGVSTTVGGISTDVNSPGSPVIENASTTAATLTVNNTSPNVSTFAGTIQDGTPATGTPAAFSLTKAGTGTLLLSGGSNSFSGATTVQNGTLQVGNPGSLSLNSAVTIGGAATSAILDLFGSSPTVSGLNSGATGVTNIVTNTSNSSPATLNVAVGTSSFGGVIKDGAQPVALSVNSGSLTLTANNTFSGDTTINSTTSGGKLIVNGSLLSTGNVIVTSGGTLGGTGSVGKTTLNAGSIVTPGAAAAGNFTMATLTTNGGDIRYDLPATDVGVHDKVTVSGAATFNSSTTLTLVNPLLPAGGTYTLMSYSSFTDGGNNSNDPVLVAPANSRINYHYAVGPTAITISPTGTPLSLSWTGSTPGDGSTWDTSTANSSKNWSNSGGAVSNDTFFNLDAVTFGNGPTNRNVVLNSSVLPQSVTVNNSAGNDYTISGGGSIDGPTLTLTKSGSGKLTLATNNSYAGGTIINDNGTLEVGNGGGSGTLGTGAITGPTTGGGASLRINRGGSLSINSAISGILSLTVTGGAQLSLGSANTYSGGTNVGNGALTLGAAGSLPTGAALTLGDAANNNGTLDLGGFNASVSSLNTVGTGGGSVITNSGPAGTLTVSGAANIFNGSFQGSTALALQTGASLTVSGGYSATGAITDNGTLIFGVPSGNDFTLAQAITGTGSFQQTGGNVISLTNGANNNFKGGVTVSSGTLRASGSGGFSALGTGNVTVSAGATLIGTNGDAFGYTAGAGTSPLTFNIAGGTVTNLGTVSYRLTMPNLTFTGGTLTSAAGNNGDVNGQYSLQGTVINGVFTLATNAAPTTALVDAPSVSIESNSTFNVAAGSVTGGPTPGIDLLITSALKSYNTQANPVIKTGSGVMVVTGANVYTGTTTISGGTLLVNGTHVGGGDYSVASTATLGGSGTIGANVNVAAGGFLAPGTGLGTLHISGTTTLAGTLNTELQASLHDVLDSTGPLNIGSGAAANFTLLGNITTTHFVFANYPTGGLTGTFGAPTFSLGPSAANVPIPTGASIANDTVNHQLVLNVSPQSLRGNFNLDSTVDASDIAVMLQALTDLNAYKNGNNPLHVTLTASDLNALGDFDNTGSVTNRDIQPMLDYIASLPGGGSVASVPEPASLLLLALGGMFLLAQRRARNRTRLPAVKF